MVAVAVAISAMSLTVHRDFPAAHLPSPAAHVLLGGGGEETLAGFEAGVGGGRGGGGAAADKRSRASSTTSSVGKTLKAPVGTYVAIICVFE
jgi:hypothetical protein